MKTWQRHLPRQSGSARHKHQADKKLIFAVGFLLIFGLIMLSSASSVTAYANHADSYYFLKRQLLFGILPGLICYFIFSKLNYHIWKKYAFYFLILSIVSLLLVFIPGLSSGHGGARSWIEIFGFSLQPSEFVKLFFLLYLAAWIEARQNKLSDFHQGIGPFVMVLGIIVVLMLLQPDLGTLMIILATSILVYFVGGGKIKHIIIILIIGALGLTFMIQQKPYQLDRFRCLVDTSFSTDEVCYQLNQAYIAVGSGGWIGRGLGQSRQKFMYLPEVIGDSIFAVIAEEIGFIFSLILIFLYFYIFYRGYLIAKRAPDIFGSILAIGIVIWIFVQAFINIGGMLGLVPMAGVPLPFISQGGSAILSTLIGVGILVNISKYTKEYEK